VNRLGSSREREIVESVAIKENLVVCHNNQGVEVRASLLRLTRYRAVVEIYNPVLVVRLSEVLTDFKIIIRDRAIYSGRAVVSNLVNTGTVLVCETKLDEGSFSIASFSPLEATNWLQAGFSEFLGQWQKIYKVLPEFKVVVADMQTFLTDLRMWLEQVELEMRSATPADLPAVERNMAHEVGQAMVPAFDAMHERLEDLSGRIEEEYLPVHHNFSKRQLHPLVLCSPFASRTFHKPLGYAGDYEMVNMIVRDPYEGASLFAKVVNLWFLSQWPAKAHRNRIVYLKERLLEESLRALRRGKPMRVLNLGCGPAREIQEFLMEQNSCDVAQFTLLDFNEETIAHTRHVLDEIKRHYGRRTPIQIQKKSVHQVLREGNKPHLGEAGKYDYIYCAGLFDYLSDRTCKQLMNIFYDWLVPGGLLVATNVDDCKPFRHMLEFVLDWHLIYRDPKKGATLIPDRAPAEAAHVLKDSTTVNVFIEVRKPDHA
jgi:extracellular factor (EF) 3-hydroxypalmitic acid methyl ester biosynthesis protein